MSTGTPTTTFRESPAVEQALEQSMERRGRHLAGRERAAELLVGAAFVVAALALFLADGGATALPWPAVLITVVALAVASHVTFDVGSSYTMPLEIVVVPMLFLLPPAVVPACVAAALLLARFAEAVVTRSPPSRAVQALGDSWFALGPALVFAIAQPGAPDGHDWPLYVVALAAQFGFDAGAGFLRDTLHGEPALGDLLRANTWIWLVDVLLAPVGLAVAFGAVGRPWLVLMTLPLAALFMFFARERAARVGHAVELGRAYRGTALVLGNVVEADDAYTGMHSEGVVDLATDVADDLRLGATERRNVEFAALLHDVGKIAIPNEIINKPGRLDDDEWKIIRGHTIEGQRLLDKVGGVMREVGQIVRSSHESFDGTGYPDGLAGEQIPLEARVVSCCDAFNAMTTDRPYRGALQVEDAIAELRRCAGTQFDPRVVKAAVAVVERRTGRTFADSALLPDPGSLLRQPAQ